MLYETDVLQLIAELRQYQLSDGPGLRLPKLLRKAADELERLLWQAARVHNHPANSRETPLGTIRPMIPDLDG